MLTVSRIQDSSEDSEESKDEPEEEAEEEEEEEEEMVDPKEKLEEGTLHISLELGHFAAGLGSEKL